MTGVWSRKTSVTKPPLYSDSVVVQRGVVSSLSCEQQSVRYGSRGRHDEQVIMG